MEKKPYVKFRFDQAVLLDFWKLKNEAIVGLLECKSSIASRFKFQWISIQHRNVTGNHIIY